MFELKLHKLDYVEKKNMRQMKVNIKRNYPEI